MAWIDRVRNLFRRQHQSVDGPSCPVPNLPTNDEMRDVLAATRVNRDELVELLSRFSWGDAVLRESNVVANEFEEEQLLIRLDQQWRQRASR